MGTIINANIARTRTNTVHTRPPSGGQHKHQLYSALRPRSRPRGALLGHMGPIGDAFRLVDFFKFFSICCPGTFDREISRCFPTIWRRVASGRTKGAPGSLVLGIAAYKAVLGIKLFSR